MNGGACRGRKRTSLLFAVRVPALKHIEGRKENFGLLSMQHTQNPSKKLAKSITNPNDESKSVCKTKNICNGKKRKAHGRKGRKFNLSADKAKADMDTQQSAFSISCGHRLRRGDRGCDPWRLAIGRAFGRRRLPCDCCCHCCWRCCCCYCWCC